METTETKKTKKTVPNDDLPEKISTKEQEQLKNNLEKDEKTKERELNKAANKAVKDPENKKGKYLFKCVKIQYRKNEQGYVMVPKEGDKPKKLDPMKLHIELIDKKNTGLTAAVDEEDINLNNSQSLNTGIFLVKVDEYKNIKFE